MSRDTFKEVVMPLIQEIEAEYGSVTLCPKDDKKLKRIHVLLGVQRKYRMVSIDTKRIRELVAERGEAMHVISKEAKMYGDWLGQTLRRGAIRETNVGKLAEVFGVDEEDVVL